MRDSFIFYRSFYEATIPLEKQQKAELLEAICEYALNQNVTKTKPMVTAMFALIKPQLDANQKRFENGSKGGRKPKRNQNVTKTKPNVNVNDNNNVNKNVKKTVACSENLEDWSKEFYWVHSNTHSLVEMKQPLDDKTTRWFANNFPEDVWHDVFESMENYPNIKTKYKSAKSTAISWLKRRGWLSYERMKKATIYEAKEAMGKNQRAMAIFQNKNPRAFHNNQ